MISPIQMSQDFFGSLENVTKKTKRSSNMRGYYIAKRIVDTLLAVTMLIILSPIMLVIALLIKFDSPGSIFFIQERMGAKPKFLGKETIWEPRKFRMYKFRSMRQDADQSLHQSFIKSFINGNVEKQSSDENAPYKLVNDPRITRVGAFIRKTSLDELPQLINVIKGEMSLVGPRPVPVYEVEEYRPWHRERLNALPGITGLWQVAGRSRVQFEEMTRMDIEYCERQSLWLDIKLLVLTIPAIISSRGAL